MTLVRDVPVKSACVLPLTTAHQRLVVLNFASAKPAAYDQAEKVPRRRCEIRLQHPSHLPRPWTQCPVSCAIV
jgi:hypothetical protein